MDLTAFLDHIKRGEIPPESPDGTTPGGYGYTAMGDKWLEFHHARDECTSRGMWAIVSQDWTRALAKWIGKRTVLEIMAGAGWLAKALHDHGVTITATDNYSWDKDTHGKMKRVYPVEQLHALEAVIKYKKAGILLVSWPPYEDETLTAVCRLWGKRKPIIYIGESQGGCNAPDSFWSGYDGADMDGIRLASWDGIHDRIMSGRWARG